MLAKHFEFIDRRSVRYLTDWLVDGFVSHYVYESRDSFYPHSHFGAGGDPLYAVREAYRALPARAQSKLRSAVEGLLTIGAPDALFSGSSEVSVETKLNLLSIVSTLAAETGSLRGAPIIADAVTSKIEQWGSDEHQKVAFALGLRGLVGIASEAKRHPSYSHADAAIVESSLVRAICSPRFDSRYIARCAYALLQICEDAFFRHYEALLREHFFRMHEADSTELEHAHLTADLIVDRLPKQLMAFAPKMEIMGPRPRDLWMLRAWDSPHSKFFLHRPDRNAGKLALTRRSSAASKITRSPTIAFENSSFYKYQVKSTIEQGISTVAGVIKFAGLTSITSILKPPQARH